MAVTYIPVEELAIPLMPFQRAGVDLLRPLSHPLLADEMGLGKTLESMAWAVSRPSPHNHAGTLVICPNSVKLKWQREIARARPEDGVMVIDSPNPKPPKGTRPDWVIVNYDRFWRGKLFESLKVTKFANMILDEAHFVKNQKSKRGKAAEELSRDIPNTILVTGTPIMNRPYELFPLLVIMRRFKKEHFWHYVNRYCAPERRWIYVGGRSRKIWDFSGASNLRELHETIKPFMVRRLKAEVLPELPPKTYTDVPVSLANGAEYRAAEANARANLNGGAGAVFMKLKQLAAIGKVPEVSGLVDNFIENERKVVVFCTFLDPLHQLKKRFKGYSAMIVGEYSQEQRQENIDRFRSDPHCYVMLCSTMAGGFGIDLTSAEAVIFVDLPWTPAACSQAEDRTHRIGQTNAVEVIRCVALGTIDQRLLDILEEKKRVFAQAVEGVTEADVFKELKKSFEWG